MLNFGKLTLLNYQKCFYFWCRTFEGMYFIQFIAVRQCEDTEMLSEISAVNLFQKMFPFCELFKDIMKRTTNNREA